VAVLQKWRNRNKKLAGVFGYALRTIARPFLRAGLLQRHDGSRLLAAVATKGRSNADRYGVGSRANDFPSALNVSPSHRQCFLSQQIPDGERIGACHFTGPGAHFSSPHAARVITLESLANVDEAVGDYADAVAQYGELMNETHFEGSHWLAVRMASADAALAHDVANSRQILGGAPDADLLILCCTSFGWQPPNFNMPQFRQFAVLDDRRDGLKDIKAVMSVPHAATTKPQGDKPRK
jgi:hypothetical protein